MPDPPLVDLGVPDADATSRRHGRPASVEELLDDVIEIVRSAKSMPLSSSAIITRDEVLALLVEARAAAPEETRRARLLVREKQEFLAKARREAEELLEEARVQTERMVQRTEIIRQAEHKARRILEESDAEARRMRREAEDFVDHKLGAFEIVLDRTIKLVQAGRARLATIPFAPAGGDVDLPGNDETSEGAPDGDEGLFDQDLY